MRNSLAQPILRPVPLVARPATPGAGQPAGTPVPLPAPAEAQLARAQDLAAPAAVALVEHETAPDLVAAVRAFNGPVDGDTTTMSAYDFPVFLRQALEAIARAAQRTKQHTVAAVLDRGLPILCVFPGLEACLDARPELLGHSRDPHVHRWLE